MTDSLLFGPKSVTWRIHSDPSMIVGGLRALMIQALHPLAMAGVAQHSDYRKNPWGRLDRTSGFVMGVTFGTESEAEVLAARVRGVHGVVEGVDPVTGRYYRADDPELLAWVHNVMVDSFIRAKRRYGGGLDVADSSAYLREMVRMATLVGIPTDLVPLTDGDLEDYLASFHGLVVSESAVEALGSVLNPPMALPLRPLWGVLTTAAVGLLPARVRRMYRMPWFSPADPAVAIAMTALFGAVKVLKIGPPQRLAADTRLAA